MFIVFNIVVFFVDVFDIVVFVVIKRVLYIFKIVIKVDVFIFLKYMKKYCICCLYNNLLLIKNN